MDIEITIKDDTTRGVVIGVLLTVFGGLFFIIIQAVREVITWRLFKTFPKNKGKLYVMTTSRDGSFLEGYTNISIPHINTGSLDTVPMDNFVLQDFNNTITSSLPWASSNPRVIAAIYPPPEINQVPLERLARPVEYSGIFDFVEIYALSVNVLYTNGSFFEMTIGNNFPMDPKYALNTGWIITDDNEYDSDSREYTRSFGYTTNTTTGFSLLLYSTLNLHFGDDQFRNDSATRVRNSNYDGIDSMTFIGNFNHRTTLGRMDLTFQGRSNGTATTLEMASSNNSITVKRFNSSGLYDTVLSNLIGNENLLESQGLLYQRMSRANTVSTSDQSYSSDFLSYVGTCWTMAVSQTRPVGMIKGREQADIITTVISVKIAYAIPLIVIALLSLVVYSYINLNLLLNSKNLLSYKLHVNARDYLPNLYDNKFTVDTVKNDREVLDNLRENPKILGPIFEHGQEGLENIKLL